MGQRRQYRFALQVQPNNFKALGCRYLQSNRYKETEAEKAGNAIRDGAHTFENCSIIFEWKTRGRGRSRFARNSRLEVEDALALVVAAKTDRSALAVLLGLKGVDIPVASAILAWIFPERFTIIDFRALEAFGIPNYYLTIDLYFDYREQCDLLRTMTSLSYREIDRALWQWSSEK